LTVIAGPCAVESREQYLEAARKVREAGAVMLRGGAWKPRTSPYGFQGLGPSGLDILEAARSETGLPVVTEALDEESLARVAERADMIQIGSRNMHNFSLLKRAARAGRPILLKRGMSATVEDLLLSAEYVLAEGNPSIVLCERGIRTFSTHSRFTLDLSVVPVLRERTHLPVIVDPSHACGVRSRVVPMALAATAAGADGLMVEVHADPGAALCDGPQALVPSEFAAMMEAVSRLAPLVGRALGTAP
jgi:3-deoxy-7-phosphoheptulonate synthase